MALTALAAAGLSVAGFASTPGLATGGPSHTIASATALPEESAVTGGGASIDFWTVQLAGGYSLSFDWNLGNAGADYNFELYAPGTTDATFADATPLVVANDLDSASFTLTAPYTGQFILAVCEYSIGNDSPTCGKAGPGGVSSPGVVVDPMDPYTFSAALNENGISATEVGAETRASQTIAGAPDLTGFEAGGGGNIDFWAVQLSGGYSLLFNWNLGNAGADYNFELYPPGTTDATFAETTPLVVANDLDSASFTLTAPYTGQFILAVCEYSIGNDSRTCGKAGPGGVSSPGVVVDPMDPYSFSAAPDKNGISAGRVAEETRASQTIAGAPELTGFEAGGGAGIDFWKVSLTDGHRLSFDWNLGNAQADYNFELYAPGTTDATFAHATPLEVENDLDSAAFSMTAPRTGEFILAVCEYPEGGDQSTCDQAGPGGVSSPGAVVDPMDPYTFAASVPGLTSKPFSATYCLAFHFYAAGKAVSSGKKTIRFATDGKWKSSSDTGAYTYNPATATLTFTDNGDTADGRPMYTLVGVPATGFAGVAASTAAGFDGEMGSAVAAPGTCPA